MIEGETAQKKKVLRVQVLDKCRELLPSVQQTFSEMIWEQVKRFTCYEQAKQIFCFVSMENEVQTLAFIQEALNEGKEVSVPLITNRGVMDAVRVRNLSDLVPDAFGILTARVGTRILMPPETIDCVIVPGVAFSRKGARLGHGGGYYDRFFYEKAPQAYRVAVAFSCQVMDDIPMEDHDVLMHRIVTEKESIICG